MRYEIIGDGKRLFVSGVVFDYYTREPQVRLISKETYHKLYKNTKGYYIKLNGKNWYITNQIAFEKMIKKIEKIA